jgi:hypothetical protein
MARQGITVPDPCGLLRPRWHIRSFRSIHHGDFEQAARPCDRGGVEAQALASKMMTMQADAGLTIAMRMPILMKGAFGDSRGQREAAKAVRRRSRP